MPAAPPSAAGADSGDPARQPFRFSNPSWKVPGGYIVWNRESGSYDAHCDNPLHYCKKNPCRLNRTLTPWRNEKTTNPDLLASGRPLGLLIRWLQATHHDTSRLHKDMVSWKTQTKDDLEFCSFDNREKARDWVEEHLPLSVRIRERPRRAGEGLEPQGIA